MASAVAVSKPLQDISTFLDNYWSRDQVFRTLQYASTLCSGLLEPRIPRAASKFTTLASSISTMRTTLRLLDDIPNLVQTLNRLRQQKDPSLILRLTDLFSCLSALLYYPTEHIAWAADLAILPIQSTTGLWNFCIVLWIVSLSAACVRSLVTLLRANREIRTLQTHAQPQSGALSPTLGSPKNERKRVTFQDESTSNNTRLRVLRRMCFQSTLSLVRCMSDLMNAIHYLPSGVLWGGMLPRVWVGLFGTISSLVGLYRSLPCAPRSP